MIGLAALAPATASAATAPYDPFAIYHVAPNGSDSNPGTAGQPFRTIGKALSISQVVNARNITVRHNVLQTFIGDAMQFAHWTDATIDGNVMRLSHDPT